MFISEATRQKKRDAGRMGGLAKLRNHGRQVFVEMGKRGGRPKVDLAEMLRQSLALEAINKVEGGELPNDLKKLKRLWLNCRRSSGYEKQEGRASALNALSPTGGV